MGFFGVTQNALGNGAWSFKIVISHPGSSYWGDTLPETNGFSPWKWMGRTLVSFWGPAYFQGQTVSFRECMSRKLPPSIQFILVGISQSLSPHHFPREVSGWTSIGPSEDLPKKWKGWKSFENKLRIVILHINVMICSGLLAVLAGWLGEAEVGSHLQLTWSWKGWSVAAQWRVKHVEHWSNEKNPGCLGGFSGITTQLYGENIS